MRAVATLYLTSGFPSITIELTMDDAFFQKYVNDIPFQPRSPSNDLRVALGAPTLVVDVTTDAGEPRGTFTWRFHRVRFEDAVGQDQDRLLVDWLQQAYNLVAGTTPISLPDYWLKELMEPEPIGVKRLRGVPPDPPRMPQCRLAPSDVFMGPAMELMSNCYNYACNIEGDGAAPAMPGRNSPNAISDRPTIEDLRRACAADGLRFVERLNGVCADSDGHVIALINRPPQNRGYHFFRLNRDGTWSHKDGQGIARKTDDTIPNGVTITSLTTADFAYPYEFVGYFYCPSRHSVD
jgi:hypothetical protein